MDEIPRDDRDVFRLAPNLDDALLQTVADRLEMRGGEQDFVALSQAYFDRLALTPPCRVLALGCGTGVETRALRRRSEPGVEIVGVDHSDALVARAREIALEEGLGDGIRYVTGDAQELPFADAEFDVVTMHTLISHVDRPAAALAEAHRTLRPGGTLAIFDGDYATLTFSHPDPTIALAVEDRLKQALVANPRVMRDLPRLLAEAGLELVAGDGVVYADVGRGGFWLRTAEAYATVLRRSGLLPPEVVEAWRVAQVDADASRTFFGASVYYTYLARRPR